MRAARQIDRARQLRTNQTDVERRLWLQLRDRRLLGHKFRRQVPIGPFIADFVCVERSSIIELDGGQHSATTQRDDARTDWLSRHGWLVMRFWNNEVAENIDGVLQHIAATLRRSQTTLTPPSPASGRGRIETMTALPASVTDTLALLGRGNYVADRSLATAVYLALKLGRPLFLEGEAGVGKTEIAKVLAATLGRPLIRLQCYEGLDVASAVYEWNYARQMIEIRLAEAGKEGRDTVEEEIFSERFLIKRPLLQALEPSLGGAPVLLIDELDRTDEPFEAYLLEILSDFQVTIPEIGTIKAEQPPIVVITSNRTREIHDALKRRCFYYWVDYPDAERELEILKVKAPGAGEALSREVVAFVQKLRGQDLFKLPGVAETIDWTQALMQLDVLTLTPEAINDTLGVLLKYQDDIAKIQGSEALKLLNQVKSELANSPST